MMDYNSQLTKYLTFGVIWDLQVASTTNVLEFFDAQT